MVAEVYTEKGAIWAKAGAATSTPKKQRTGNFMPSK